MADKPVIIKKKHKHGSHGGGHHGGSWKVAYADFVTTMMMLFMVLWLLHPKYDIAKKGESQFFYSDGSMETSAGVTGVLGGKTIISDGAMDSLSGFPTMHPLFGAQEPAYDQATGFYAPEETLEEVEKREAIDRTVLENELFEKIKKAIEQGVLRDEILQKRGDQLLIDITTKGLEIQLIEQYNRPMFNSGSSELLKEAKGFLAIIARILQKLPHKIDVIGHTDSHPYSSSAPRGNWELSTRRANEARRYLSTFLSSDRFAEVSGRADTNLLFPHNPLAPGNRRISLVLLRKGALPEGQNF